MIIMIIWWETVTLFLLPAFLLVQEKPRGPSLGWSSIRVWRKANVRLFVKIHGTVSATLPPLLNNDQLTGPCKLGDPALTSSSSSGCDPGCLKIIIVIVFKNYQMDFTICSVRSNKDVQPENATFQLKVPWELTKLFSPGKSGQELLLITSRCSIPSLCNWFIITIK